MNKILPESLFPNPTEGLNSADTGANIHTSTAITPIDMSKIIFNPLITILFIADTGTMAPICVKIGPIKIKN